LQGPISFLRTIEKLPHEVLALDVHSSALEAPLFEDALLVTRMEFEISLVITLGIMFNTYLMSSWCQSPECTLCWQSSMVAVPN